MKVKSMNKNFKGLVEREYDIKIDKKFDCDWDNYTDFQNGCGECKVCKYLSFLDYASNLGVGTVEHNKVIDRYLEIQHVIRGTYIKLENLIT